MYRDTYHIVKQVLRYVSYREVSVLLQPYFIVVCILQFQGNGLKLAP